MSMSDHFVMLWGDMLASSIIEEDVHVKWAFVVCLLLCDAQGEFRSAPGHLARAGGMSLEEAGAALRVLSGPDPASTSKEEGGRRIVSIGPNTWRVVNYPQYRRRAQEERRKAADRERKRLERSGLVGTDVDECGQVRTCVDGDGQDGTTSDPYTSTSSYTSTSKEEEGCGEEKIEKPLPIHDQVMDRWNKLGIVPPCTALSDQRKSAVAARRRQHGEKAVFDVVKKRAASDFLSNEFAEGRGAPFDWCFGPKNFVKILDGNYDGSGRGPSKVDPRQHVGASTLGTVSEERKRRSRTVKHIMKHANSLLKLKGLRDSQQIIVVSYSEMLEALAESDVPKAEMETTFYTRHDQMMKELLGSLTDEEAEALKADFPRGGVKWETWVRKRLQERFGIPDPLDYEFEP